MLMRTFTPAVVALLISGCAAAQAPKAEEDHSAHHPPGATAAPTAPAAPEGQYTGNPRDAFWVFDGELAKAVESFGAKYAGKKLQQVG